MTVSTHCAELLSVVLERLTEENLRASRIGHPTALDGQVYAAFGIDSAATGDTAGFQRLQHLAEDLTHASAAAPRLLELKSKGMSVDFTVYDEPAGHYLCVLIKDHAIYDKSFKLFEPGVAPQRRQQLLSWIRGMFAV